MRILFVHQNFPGQYRRLAPELAKRGHDILSLGAPNAKGLPGIATLRYKYDLAEPDDATFKLASNFASHVQRGAIVAQGAAELRKSKSYVPDLVCGHIGWGETLFLKQVWPESKILLYAEFFYKTRGQESSFDPEFQPSTLGADVNVVARTGPLLLALNGADRYLAPTQWQAGSFPPQYRDRISVIHDGIDTDVVTPDPAATFAVGEGKPTFKVGDEVLTFVNRNHEPHRGHHIFMRTLPQVLAARPNAHVVIVGGDGRSYSPVRRDGRLWRVAIFDEVKDRLDLSRVHYVGQVPYAGFVNLMRVSRVHAYLTYPFVLSWSMLEAMSAEALVVGSKTPPVEEVIEHGRNGLLVDFFDIDAWAATLTDALARPDRFSALRKAARKTVVARYDWRTKCLPELVGLIERG